MDSASALGIDARALAVLCQRYGVRRLALFGSVLREDFGPASDVDLLVEFQPGRSPSFFRLFELEEALSPVFGGRTIDLRTVEDLSPYFRDEVVRTSRPVYDAA